MGEGYAELLKRLREASTLSTVADLLGWDQETMMPPKAGDFRADELAAISKLAHEHATDPRLGDLLAACEADPALVADEPTAANLREMRRDYDRARKLPPDLVAEISEVGSRAMEAWKVARAASDFESFRPWLERQLVLVRRKAACYGIPPGGEAYDALLEDYEPGMTAAVLESIFEPLRAELVRLIRAVTTSPSSPDLAPIEVELPIPAQQAFNLAVVARLGFDLQAGRLDTSTHPFSTGLGPGDTRITTRYRTNAFADALGSTLHEAGHGLYEQGLPKAEYFGQPRAQTPSLGIHESQSRLWENQIGRSRAFWEWALPEARRAFDSAFDRFSVDDLYRAVNVVRPSLIRVESDEATYNLHIMFRFDLERALVRGDLVPADLPAAWNERVKRDLGLPVPDDRRGCLQDVHWSMGAIGYFPTYTLGNLYAAQLWDVLSRELPEVEREIARGEFGGVLGWLRRNVHAHGRRYAAAELCRRLTGEPLSHRPLVRYLGTKLGAIYRLGERSPAPAD